MARSGEGTRCARVVTLVLGLAGFWPQAAPAQPAVTEFSVPTVNGGPTGITVGPDGNLWRTEFFTNKIGRFSPAFVTISPGSGALVSTQHFDRDPRGRRRHGAVSRRERRALQPGLPHVRRLDHAE